MATKLLTEIERYRELMGVKLLKEVTLPKTWFAGFAESFGKTQDDLFKTLLKNEDEISTLAEKILKRDFNEIATASGRSLNDFLTGLKAGTLGDDILDDLAVKLLKSSDAIVVKNTVEAFVKEYPSLKMLQSSFNDTAFMVNILKSGDTGLIKDLDSLKNQIQKLNIGDESKKYFTDLYTVSYNAAKTEADKIAKETSEALVKQGELLQEIIRDNTRKETIELAKKTKAKDLKNKMEELVKNGNLPKTSEEYTKLNEYFDKILKESPDAKLDDLVTLGETQFNILIKKYDDAVKEGAEKTREFWRGAGRTLTKYLNYANLGRRAKSPIAKVLLNILGYAAILGTGYLATKGVTKLIYGTDLTSEELNLLKEKVKNNLGKCIIEDEITIVFINTKQQSESDVFDPDNFGEAVIDVPINGVTTKLEYSVKLSKFHLVGDETKIVTCETTPGLGVTSADLTQPSATTGLSDVQITDIKNDFTTKYGSAIPEITNIDVINEKNVSVKFKNGRTFNYTKDNLGQWI